MQGDYKILINKLNSFIKEYYKNLMIRGIVIAFIVLISILIAASTTEHFGFYSSGVRTILFWSYCIIGLMTVFFLVIRPAIKMWRLTDTLSHNEAAKIIGQHFPEVSDRLINILELKNNTRGNKDLIEASVQQKITTIKLKTFNRAIDWKTTKLYSKFVIIPILIVAFFIFSGNKAVLSESAFRIIKYNSVFEKPAPFYFVINEDSLYCLEKEAIDIHVRLTGSERPEEVFVNYNNSKKRLKKINASHYSYKFKNIRENLSFFISANEVLSKEYKIRSLQRPEIQRFNVAIFPPKNTGLNKEFLKNTGAITVPEGSMVEWEIKTQNTDSIKFIFKDMKYVLQNKKDTGIFTFKKRIRIEGEYSISLANKNALFVDTVFYDIKIIRDARPTISIQKDSNTNLIVGKIQDDYGFFDLQMFAEVSGGLRDTVIIENIQITPDQRSQLFTKSMDLLIDSLEEGQTINIKCIVRDNDKLNGYKLAESNMITFFAPTYKDVIEQFEETNNNLKNSIDKEVTILENLQNELENFEKTLIEKDSLSWKDLKDLEDILKKQNELETKLEEFKKATQNNFEKLNSEYEPSEKILKKQKELEKLFEEIMTDEMRDLYDELNRLKEELSKEELQESLRELQLSNEDLEKELDRNLELLKEMEFEQRLESLVDQLKSLSENQINNSNNSTEPKKELEKQLKENEKFENLRKEIENIKNLNSNLENKRELESTDQKESEISELLKEAAEKLKKKQEKKASKSQNSAGEKLKSLSDLFKKMQSENQEDQAYEDMDMLRQILENLIYFSLEKEDIFITFQSLHKDDPQYVELMHAQQELKDASIVIKDSLYALSRRLPQISSKVNREIRSIDTKTNSAINHLRERLTLKAVQDQQFVMTAANNLAVMLFRVLESMQNDMANSLPSSQQCQKQGNGKPKPSDLKRMQKELKEQMEKMQKQCENGKQNMLGTKMSQQLVQMLAKQELIRHSLEGIQNEISDKESMKALQEAIENMEKIEEDIANKNITIESLNRQKKILTRLLEVEDALREQQEDNKRESKTASTQYEKIVKETLEKYELEQLRQIEIIKSTPPSLNIYYKEKVDRYFKNIINE